MDVKCSSPSSMLSQIIEPTLSGPSEAQENPEGSEPKMGCTFPEFLVHDLEASTAVFASKNMTAGPPTTTTFSARTQQAMPQKVYGPISIVDLGPGYPDSDYLSSPSPGIRYQPLPFQTRTLDPIEEQTRAVEPTENIGFGSNDDDCDWDSTSSDHSSSFLEPPSVRGREVSVITTATSLASGRLSRASSHKPANVEQTAEMSWIDVDSDSDGPELREDENRASPISPSANRLPVWPEADNLTNPFATPVPSTEKANLVETRQAPAHCVPNTEDRMPLYSSRVAKRLVTRRRRGVRMVSDSHRLARYSRSLSVVDQEFVPGETEMPALVPFDSVINLRATKSFRTNSTSSCEEVQQHGDFDRHQPPFSDGKDGGYQTGAYVSEATTNSAPNHRASPQPPAKGPLVINVQTWLESSVGLMASSKGDDESMPGIPLPPDVVDNIRVSITCFPDTMLLTSSLSIDTIRTYSRKVRTPMPDLAKESSSTSTIQSPRRWGFGRIRSSKRNNGSTSVAGQDLASDTLSIDDKASTNNSESSLKAPWAPFRAIFDSRSDYLCDALYAHLVVYNYIVSLYPKVPVPAASPTRPPSLRKPKDDCSDIPQKAAAFLGITTTEESRPDTPTPSPSRPGTASSSSRNKLRSKKAILRVPSLLSIKPPPSVRTARMEKAENAMRDLLTGLARCIIRLVYTLREGRDEVVGEDEDGEVHADLFLVRALCEIVRASEEGQ